MVSTDAKPLQWGLCKQPFSLLKSCPEACMASTQSDFLDFLGLFTQPQQGFRKNVLIHQGYSMHGRAVDVAL